MLLLTQFFNDWDHFNLMQFVPGGSIIGASLNLIHKLVPALVFFLTREIVDFFFNCETATLPQQWLILFIDGTSSP